MATHELSIPREQRHESGQKNIQKYTFFVAYGNWDIFKGGGDSQLKK